MGDKNGHGRWRRPVLPALRRAGICAKLMGPNGPVSLLGFSLEDADLGVATSSRNDALTVLVYRVKKPQHPIQPGEREQLIRAEIWEPSAEGQRRSNTSGC